MRTLDAWCGSSARVPIASEHHASQDDELLEPDGDLRMGFTKGDNYVVQIHRSLDEPLRSLVIAAALAVDTALKQDNQGVGRARR
jgi:hypothetical protein